jgi:hypothetical protein
MNHRHTVSSRLISGSVALALGCATVSNAPMGNLDVSSGGASSTVGTPSVGGTSSEGGASPTATVAASSGGTHSTGGITSISTTGGSRAAGGATYGSTVATIPLPYTDDFEGSNLNMWMLWNTSSSALGGWAIAADATNHVLQQSNSASSATYDVGGDVTWANQKFSVKVRWTSTSTVVYVSARFNSPESYYYLQATPGSKPKIRVRTSGSTTDVCAGTTNFAGVAGTWYAVTITAQGSTLSADIDGNSICSGTNTSVSTGGIAVGTDGGPAAFDDVSVTAP